MRPVSFGYCRPESLKEAIRFLSDHEDSKALAGGHSLIPAMNLRLAQPKTLVDIGRLSDLKNISETGGSLIIGALCTHAQIADSEAVQRHAPALSMAAAQIGDHQVRCWGTIGGNLAHADPASDPPTVVTAFDGIIHADGPGGARSIPAKDFFVDLFATDLKPGELITKVELPSAAGKKSAYAKLAHPASRYALVGVCVVLETEGSSCVKASVAAGGLTHKATRCPATEAALAGTDLDKAALARAAKAIQDELGQDLIGDHFAPADYRRSMAGVYLKRAVQAAIAE